MMCSIIKSNEKIDIEQDEISWKEEPKRKRDYVKFYDSDDETTVYDEEIVTEWDWDDDIADVNASDDNSEEKGVDLDIVEEPVTTRMMKNELEYSCMTKEELSFPDSQKLLEHPNFWIADTAASIHMTPHKAGLINIRQTTNKIQMGDKSSVTTIEVGDLYGDVCD